VSGTLPGKPIPEMSPSTGHIKKVFDENGLFLGKLLTKRPHFST
jgi:hypothetical protein